MTTFLPPVVIVIGENNLHIVDIFSAPSLINIVCEQPLVGIQHGFLKAEAAALIGLIPSLGFTEEMEK